MATMARPDIDGPESARAILVMPHTRGWRWEVVDPDGSTRAAGEDLSQVRAMEAAWQAAKTPSWLTPRDAPEIFVRHDRYRA